MRSPIIACPSAMGVLSQCQIYHQQQQYEMYSMWMEKNTLFTQTFMFAWRVRKIETATHT